MEKIRAHFDSIVERAKSGIDAEDAAWEFVQMMMFNHPEKWEDVAEYGMTGMNCNVVGHICPVFFTAYGGVTETRAKRRPPSRYIPRDVMLQVVRRDGQRCQKCWRNVPDNELHFDHLIPISKGGPSTVANLRVLCQDCNLEKSDDVAELLDS